MITETEQECKLDIHLYNKIKYKQTRLLKCTKLKLPVEYFHSVNVIKHMKSQIEHKFV